MALNIDPPPIIAPNFCSVCGATAHTYADVGDDALDALCMACVVWAAGQLPRIEVRQDLWGR